MLKMESSCFPALDIKLDDSFHRNIKCTCTHVEGNISLYYTRESKGQIEFRSRSLISALCLFNNNLIILFKFDVQSICSLIPLNKSCEVGIGCVQSRYILRLFVEPTS